MAFLRDSVLKLRDEQKHLREEERMSTPSAAVMGKGCAGVDSAGVAWFLRRDSAFGRMHVRALCRRAAVSAL